MKPLSNLDAILQDGYSLQCDWENYGPQNATISTHQIGELTLTSGRIIACDPLILPGARYHLKKTVKPGRYPVIVSVADFQPAAPRTGVGSDELLGGAFASSPLAAATMSPKPSNGPAP